MRKTIGDWLLMDKKPRYRRMADDVKDSIEYINKQFGREVLRFDKAINEMGGHSDVDVAHVYFTDLRTGTEFLLNLYNNPYESDLNTVEKLSDGGHIRNGICVAVVPDNIIRKYIPHQQQAVGATDILIEIATGRFYTRGKEAQL